MSSNSGALKNASGLTTWMEQISPPEGFVHSVKRIAKTPLGNSISPRYVGPILFGKSISISGIFSSN